MVSTLSYFRLIFLSRIFCFQLKTFFLFLEKDLFLEYLVFN